MTLKTTCKCGVKLTTKNVERLGLVDMQSSPYVLLLGNCKACNSSVTLEERVKSLKRDAVCRAQSRALQRKAKT